MLRRSPSPTADISVGIDPRPLYPGDALDAEVVVTPHVSFVAALGLVRLAQTELVRVYSAGDAMPHAMLPRQRAAVSRRSRPADVEHVFAEDAAMDAGVAQRYPVRLQVPDNAMPTVKGKHAHITWELSAALMTRADWMPVSDGLLANLTRGRVAQFSQELVVFAHPDGLASGADILWPATTEPIATREFRNVSLDLELESARVANGGTIAGSLSVKSRASFRARELRVELARWERSGNKQARVVESRHVLQRPAVFTANEETDWAFRLPVPDRLMPSVLASHTFVGWQVRAVIARAIRPDLNVSQPVQVYTSPQAGGSGA